MRFSDALILGNSLSIQKINNVGWDTCLCAVAVTALSEKRNWANIEARKRWPWLTELATASLRIRNKGVYIINKSQLGSTYTWEVEITGLCSHVICGHITIDQVADFMRKYSPDLQPCKEQTQREVQNDSRVHRKISVSV